MGGAAIPRACRNLPPVAAGRGGGGGARTPFGARFFPYCVPRLHFHASCLRCAAGPQALSTQGVQHPCGGKNFGTLPCRSGQCSHRRICTILLAGVADNVNTCRKSFTLCSIVQTQSDGTMLAADWASLALLSNRCLICYAAHSISLIRHVCFTCTAAFSLQFATIQTQSPSALACSMV